MRETFEMLALVLFIDRFFLRLFETGTSNA